MKWEKGEGRGRGVGEESEGEKEEGKGKRGCYILACDCNLVTLFI